MTLSDIKSLYYITHAGNVASILKHGILSHELIDQRKIPFERVYDSEIVSRRKSRQTPAGKSLWSYANLYFQPRNPMMYRVIHDPHVTLANLAVVAVSPDALSGKGVFVTDGNAASDATLFHRAEAAWSVLSAQWPTIQSEWWSADDGSKRRIMAECLVPDQVPRDHIHSVFVPSLDAKRELERTLGNNKTPIVPEPRMFFLPRRRIRVSQSISLIDGDMFFSELHTLTVSVNLQGIMGKGLASRAKYQFPDVYVKYQDACRQKKLRVDRPFLYKRESSLDQELADLDAPIQTANGKKWFLLFATKRKWREDSRLEDIEAGLRWLSENAASEGIQSLALPALGCGLGNLKWADVGPMMCRYLEPLNLKTAIYLPRESEISAEHLQPTYLLGASRSLP